MEIEIAFATENCGRSRPGIFEAFQIRITNERAHRIHLDPATIDGKLSSTCRKRREGQRSIDTWGRGLDSGTKFSKDKICDFFPKLRIL